MDNIKSDVILKDLHQLLIEATSRFSEEFILQEVNLNDTFKISFRNYLSTKKSRIDYFTKTSVVVNSFGQNIYIANQWFVIAAYFVDFCTEMLTYQHLFLKICDSKCMNRKEKNTYAITLKLTPTEQLKNEFIESALYILQEEFPDYKEDYNKVAGYLWKFASDYSWWAGSKSIDRGDFYISPLLNQLNVVNNNSEYLAIIVHAYSSNLQLRLLVDDIENFTIDLQVNHNAVQLSEAGVDHELNQPKTATINDKLTSAISISAASLERFKEN